MNESTRGSLSTPLTVVAAGLKNWLDIYSGVLLVKVCYSFCFWRRESLLEFQLEVVITVGEFCFGSDFVSIFLPLSPLNESLRISL